MLYVQVIWVLNFGCAICECFWESGVLFSPDETDEEISWLEFGVVGFDDFGNSVVVDRLSQWESCGVRLGLCRSHTSTLVRIEGGIEVLGCDTSRRWCLVEIEFASLDYQMLSGNRNSLRNFLEDKSFVLDHVCGCSWCR